MRPTRLVITCEHGGRDVPAGYQSLFAGHQALLETHRGWDPGALELGRHMAAAAGVALHAATVTRLLVDLNRSPGHRQLYSEFTRGLPSAQRQRIIERYYRPHREQVESAVAACINAGERVLHIASHSFTPVLGGVTRRADVAWLYDPGRAREVAFAKTWMAALALAAPALGLRRNYPYQGKGDGLSALLRRRYPDAAYAGIELEVNQRFVSAGGAHWQGLQALLAATLVQAFAKQAG